jgi:simple sugar transport system substrate-binding protein
MRIRNALAVLFSSCMLPERTHGTLLFKRAWRTLPLSWVSAQPCFFITWYDDAAAQVALLESTIQKKPDGIITTIIHPTVFNKALKKALDMGIPVIASNTEALLGTGDPLEHMIPYIGSNLFLGGYELAGKACEEYFSDKTKIKALVGVEAPGVYWADERARGAITYLEEKGIPFERLDIGSDSYTMGARVSEFLRKNPATNLVLSQGGAGPWGTAGGVRSAGKKPGEVIIAEYDIMLQTVQEIKSGYVTFVLDQHPYLQGYLPVIHLYMIKEYGMRAWSVDTGVGFVDKSNVDQVNALVMQQVR